MLFTKIIVVFPENHMKPINTLCGLNAELYIHWKAGGTHRYHWDLNGQRSDGFHGNIFLRAAV
jgi:hypothetical protein